MTTLPLFDLASRQAHWLAARQAAIASNVANMNTPSYRSVDVAPFETVLRGAAAPLTATHPGHVQSYSFTASVLSDSGTAAASRQPADMEGELMKEGEVHRAFELNAAIVKSFHRMIMSAVRS